MENSMDVSNNLKVELPYVQQFNIWRHTPENQKEDIKVVFEPRII